MLGRLLHTAASSLGQNPSSTRSHGSLHSVTEEAHTHNLLFPDASLLQQSQNYAYPLHTSASPTTAAAARTFDDQGEWDIQSSQDLRVIIAQDAMGSLDQSMALFDSKPPPARPPPPKSVVDQAAGGRNRNDSLQATTQSTTAARETQTPTLGPRRHGIHRDSTSLRSPLALRNAQATEAPAHIGSRSSEGAILRSSLRGKPAALPLNDYESLQNRLASEAEDEQRSLVDCMFGVTVFSYKGPSTKLHILPSDNGSEMSGTFSNASLERCYGPSARLDGPNRSQQTRSGTASSSRNHSRRPSSSASNNTNKTKEKATILITRMFSVNLPQSNSQSETNQEHDTNGEKTSNASGYPFPEIAGGGQPKPKKAKQIKTPMYGVSIVLQLPHVHRGMLAPSSRLENRSGWPSLESDPFASTGGIPSEVDGRLDHIVRHWDVITRTLSYLQSVASEKILALLKIERDTAPPPPVPLVEPEPTAPGAEPKPVLKFKPQGTNQRSLRLQTDALMGIEHIQNEAKLVVVRIAFGLRIPRVVTGQGRWGVWREEARWVGRWAGGKEQNFFFFNLLTAFLGNHTGWLNSLGPSWYKRRHFQQQLAQQSEPVAIPSRTVIVCSDKMAARRLIFLLSAFLAAKKPPFGASSPQRPDTSTSVRSYSQSPPSGIPLLRQESLRRTINKRGRGNRSHAGDPRSHKRVTSFSCHDTTMGKVPDVDPLSPVLGGHSRRQSDSRSINVTNIPISANGTSTRKNSSATTATATPNKTVPIAHFTRHGNEEQRPTSSESVASVTLRQTLNKSDSTNVSNNSTDSQSASRWGSLISGFWSNRRESSTDDSDFLALSQEGLGISGVAPNHIAQSPYKSKLARMADEASHIGDDEELYPEDLEDRSTRSPSTVQPSPDQGRDSFGDSSPTAAKAIPERPRLCESPLKMSVDENDGVVNIDLPIPRALSSSFGSHMSSPSKTQHTPCSSLDGYASACSPSRAEPETAANVAGWLKRYHEDFALQAVRSYAELVNDIKRSMKAEPTPHTTPTTPNAEGGPVEKWVDVCTTLIADTSKFSITRLRLRRRVKLHPVPPTSTHSEARPPAPLHSQYSNPYTADQLTPGFGTSDECLEEEMVEEPIMDMDGTLIDAIERVLVQSGQSSRAHSAASSRSSSVRAGRREKSDTGGGGGADSLPTLEVPRGECKRMVLGALEQVVKSVTADRSLAECGGRGRDIRGSGWTSRSASARTVPVESTLREGIRKWLHEVEDA